MAGWQHGADNSGRLASSTNSGTTDMSKSAKPRSHVDLAAPPRTRCRLAGGVWDRGAPSELPSTTRRVTERAARPSRLLALLLTRPLAVPCRCHVPFPATPSFRYSRSMASISETLAGSGGSARGSSSQPLQPPTGSAVPPGPTSAIPAAAVRRRFTTADPGWDKPSVTVFYNASAGWSNDLGDRLTEVLRRSDKVYMRHWGDYFENGSSFLSCLTDVLPSLDATVVVLGPDDPRLIDGAGGPGAEPRPNVIVELGASVAALGADHTILVTQDGNVSLPSYVTGIKHKRLGLQPSDDDVRDVVQLVEERAQEPKTVLPRWADALFVGYKLNYLDSVLSALESFPAVPQRTFTVVLPHVDNHRWDDQDVVAFTRRLEQRNTWTEVTCRPPGANRTFSVRAPPALVIGPAMYWKALVAAAGAAPGPVSVSELPPAVYDFPTTLRVVFKLALDRFNLRPRAYDLFVRREIAAFARAVYIFAEGLDDGQMVQVQYARKDGTLMPHPAASL